ncbi:TerB family tellurite resistance protein [Paenibacillus kobensis]|uniref:TerB family tellurite resistance protein n=1 Tax=Paenibacillus kobensis TaxID=59841 RepID=UPI000FDA74BF|nr:TerB family tellurite resistance protein [Paenibacillus kobensis]
MFLHFLQQKEHKEAFLELANIVASADGFVSLKEKGGLRIIAAELDLQAAPASRTLTDILGCVQDEQVRHIFMVEMLLLSYADGDYNDDEKEIIMEMKRQFGISDEKYEAFKDWVVRMDQLKIEGVKLILNMPKL